MYIFCSLKDHLILFDINKKCLDLNLKNFMRPTRKFFGLFFFVNFPPCKVNRKNIGKREITPGLFLGIKKKNETQNFGSVVLSKILKNGSS